jgi:hypothetical protein
MSLKMKHAIFIDSEYLYRVSQRLNLSHIEFDIFRKNLEDFFNDGPVKFFYYICTKYTGAEHNSFKPLVDWLSYNGFILRSRSISENYFEAESRAFIAASMAVDAMAIADGKTNLIFCIKNPETVPLLEHLRANNYVMLLQHGELSANPGVRQAVDKTLEIAKFLGVDYDG